MSGVTAEIAADFIVEAQEILDRLGEQLVALEHAPDDRDQLNAVFRGFHTLKGGAGFLGITPMVELCHAAEETLGSVRAGQAALEAQHFDAAQRSLDWLQAMLDAVGAGTEPAHAPAELIAQFSLDPVVAAAPAPASSAPASPEMIGDDEFEALLDQLHGAAAPGSAPPPAKPAAARPAPDMIDDDEFEALLDQLHGGAAPGACPAAPAPATRVAPAVPASPPRP
ncbi:Hpt domain-containing protein, partial [Pseudoxanthomonas kaohsiungensis]